MRIQPGHRRRLAGPGFTLVELLLTVSLLLLMVGAGILNFGPAQGGSQLDEGATQVESLFRYARAQAASSGRTVRIVFPDGNRSRPGPIRRRPFRASRSRGKRIRSERRGQFEAMADARPYTAQIDELVRVRPLRAQAPAAPISAGPSSSSPSFVDVAGSDGIVHRRRRVSAPQALTILFYPDGSSDSAEVVLASLDDGDAKQLASSFPRPHRGVETELDRDRRRRSRPRGASGSSEMMSGCPALRSDRRRRDVSRRGAALLEVLIALALFVAAAAVVTGALNSSLESLERQKLGTHAVDLATSVMAEIQLGVRVPGGDGRRPFDAPYQD